MQPKHRIKEQKGKIETVEEQRLLNLLQKEKLKVRKLRVSLKEYDGLFDIQQSRMKTAILAWRKATGQKDIIPDLGKLLQWLLNERITLQNELRDALVRLNPLNKHEEISTDVDTNGESTTEYPNIPDVPEN